MATAKEMSKFASAEKKLAKRLWRMTQAARTALWSATANCEQYPTCDLDLDRIDQELRGAIESSGMARDLIKNFRAAYSDTVKDILAPN